MPCLNTPSSLVARALLSKEYASELVVPERACHCQILLRLSTRWLHLAWLKTEEQFVQGLSQWLLAQIGNWGSSARRVTHFVQSVSLA